MLIIYDDSGTIKFATSDDYYVATYQKKHNKFPFIQYGTKSLWLKGESFLNDVEIYKILDEKIIKRDKIEIDKILEKRKNTIIHKNITVKNIEIVHEESEKI